MRKRRPGVRSGVVAAALFVTALAAAPVFAQTGGYVGFSAGQADDKLLDESDRGFKVFGGWRFMPGLAAEFAYVDFGRYGPAGASFDQYGVSAQFVAHLPLGDSGASLFGKAGAFSWTVDRYGGYGCCFGLTEDNGTDLAVGAGLQVDFHRHIGFRAEWERFYDVGGGDMDLITAGLLYRF